MYRAVRNLLLVALFAGVAGEANAQQPVVCGGNGMFAKLEIVGLTADQKLICFFDQSPGMPRMLGPVTGMVGNERLVGIDFRNADGQLYGLGSLGGIYVVSALNGSARRQAQMMMATTGARVNLTGQSFGMDFNPVTDQLRVVTDGGLNMHVNVDTGATEMDRAVPMTSAATAVAYTNNDADNSTESILYVIDTMANKLSIQAPEGSGTLTPVGTFSVDIDRDAGFDIFTLLRTGTAQSSVGLAALSVRGENSLVEVDLVSGQIGFLGTFPADMRVIGLAIPSVQSGVAPPTMMMPADPNAMPAPK